MEQWQTQALLDRLSEFLAVEQAGLELYTTVAARAPEEELRSRYEAFGKETSRHREVLIELITGLGGDPAYISPTARLAQLKASGLVETSMRASGLSQEEQAMNDLENVLLAETKDHADWHFLEVLSSELPEGPQRDAISAAVGEVEAQEDEHLEWAASTLSRMGLRLAMHGPAPEPTRWHRAWTSPDAPIESEHPAPVSEGLLEGADQPMWRPPAWMRQTQEG